MFATGNLRNRGAAGFALVACLLVSLVACATASSPSASAPSPEVGKLSRLDVQSQADGTVVTLLGIREPAFTSFRQTDPARVVVDLAAVAPGGVAATTAVYDGTLEDVTVSETTDEAGQPATRVELALGTAATYDVVPLEDRLEIRVIREDALDTMGDADTMAATTLAEVAEDPWVEAQLPALEEPAEAPAAAGTLGEPIQVAAAETPAPAPMESAAEAAMTPATALLAVRATPEDGGILVELVTDGQVQEHSEFVLEDPARLVVDLPGLVSRVASPQVEVGQGGVTRVRVGQHEGKVRIVVDGATGPQALRDAELRTTIEGLAVAFGGAALPVAAMPSAEEVAEAPVAVPAAAAEPTEAPATTASASLRQVYGVQFDAQAERDRVVVLSDAPAEFRVVEPSPDTVIVRILGATIDPEAAVRIAPDDPGAVSLVTAFEQPEGAPEVRVVVTRAPGARPSVSQEGAMLFLDFPRGEAHASAVPALRETTPAAVGGASGKAMAQASAQVMPDVPAALDAESGEALDLLQEGGLVDGKEYTGRRISLDFKDVDIDDVLRLIAEVSDLNIIAGDEVSGQVTIRLVDVPWDQALDVILLTKGLGFVRVNNVLRIAPADVIKAEEEARLQERRAKEKLEDLVVKLQPVNYANVKDVEKMVKRLLTARGSVDIDARTNTVILKDIASVIDEATALIKAIDTQTPQVVIEAKIVEANLDYSRELGSVWSFGVQPFSNAFDDGSPVRTDERLSLGNDFLLNTNAANNVSIVNPITSVPSGLFNLGAFLLDERFNVDLQLQAAESHGEGKVISSPRVVTLDNRKASIEQGVSIPFQTFENGDAKLEFIDAVLRLEVTPHITADRSIIMQIEVQRNAPDDSVQTPTGSPAIAKNEANTETLVKDGQTLVIGGIYVVRKADRESRVPYFHKIPVLGNAFKNKEVRDIRQELLVFVTPRIVVNPELGS